MQKLSMEQLGRKSVTDFKAAPKHKMVLVVDNVRSMHNVGSFFRTADSFLLEAIYLCGFTPVPPHRDIQKTALGATETVTWHHAANTVEVVQQLRQNGYTLVALEQVKDSTLLNQLNLPAAQPIALIVGNEVDGVQQAVLELCQVVAEIPQFGSKHSLNVSVAAGIAIWHIVQQQFLAHE